MSNHSNFLKTRVRSWLRTNAGGVPNTCKSSELNQQIHFGDDVGNASGGWVSNTWGTCPIVWDTTWKQVLIPDKKADRMISL